ncbi:MAG: hypothetical protein K9J25_04425 [Bacteroidales bacterium]|nr:hypothetical protein [Bacteroidales bacterium]
MRRSLLLTVITIMWLMSGCSVSRDVIPQDQLIITRKYVGNLLDYRRIEGELLLNPDIMWLKTSLESEFGKIGIYLRGDLELILNDRIYIRRTHTEHPGINHYSYTLESSDGEIFYRLHSFRKKGKTVLPEAVF